MTNKLKVKYVEETVKRLKYKVKGECVGGGLRYGEEWREAPRRRKAVEDRQGSRNECVVIDCIVRVADQGPVCCGPQSICGQCSQLQLTAPSNKEQAD